MVRSIDVFSPRKQLRKWENILRISWFLSIASGVMLIASLLLDRLNSQNSWIVFIKLSLLAGFLFLSLSSLLTALIADIKCYYSKKSLNTRSKEYRRFCKKCGHNNLYLVHLHSEKEKAKIYENAQKELENILRKKPNALAAAFLFSLISIPLIFWMFGYFLPFPISSHNAQLSILAMAVFLLTPFSIIFSMPSETEKFYHDLLDKYKPQSKKKKSLKPRFNR
jgi:hypothetical protein